MEIKPDLCHRMLGVEVIVQNECECFTRVSNTRKLMFFELFLSVWIPW